MTQSDDRAPAWVEEDDRHDRMLGPYGRRLLAAAALRPGQHVLDVGCGTGQTTVDAARAVTTTGRAAGIDVSATMLAAAAERAAAAGVDNIHFVNADAADHRFRRGVAQAIVSRFGTLHFADPSAAFANLRTALAAGGRLCFTAWAEEEANAWSVIPNRVLAGRLRDGLAHGHHAGPFALADPVAIERILACAGYTDVGIERVAEPVRVGADIADALSFFRTVGAAALPDVDGPTSAAVDAQLSMALAPYLRPDGVMLPAAAWLVTASNA